MAPRATATESSLTRCSFLAKPAMAAPISTKMPSTNVMRSPTPVPHVPHFTPPTWRLLQRAILPQRNSHFGAMLVSNTQEGYSVANQINRESAGRRGQGSSQATRQDASAAPSAASSSACSWRSSLRPEGLGEQGCFVLAILAGRYRLVDLRCPARVRHGTHHGGALRAHRPAYRQSSGFSFFSNPIWWLLVGAFSIGLGMKETGLLERMALAIVSRFPSSFAAQAIGFFACGTLARPAHSRPWPPRPRCSRRSRWRWATCAATARQGRRGDWPVPRHVHRRCRPPRPAVHQLLDRRLHAACHLSGSASRRSSTSCTGSSAHSPGSSPWPSSTSWPHRPDLPPATPRGEPSRASVTPQPHHEPSEDDAHGQTSRARAA